MLLVLLVAVQIALGALTVLSRRAVAINSAHVVVGALILATSLVLALRTWREKFEPIGAGAVAGRGLPVRPDGRIGQPLPTPSTPSGAHA